MKLQYRETKWVAGEVPENDDCTCESCLKEYDKAVGNFKEIAPQDQEKVNRQIWLDLLQGEGVKLYRKWQPEIGKLYDSGDLEFELEQFVHCTDASWIEPKSCDTCKNSECGCDIKQFWVLKEGVVCKECEQPSEEAKEIHDCTDYAKINCYCPKGECHYNGSQQNSWTNKYVEQLQARVKELENENELLVKISSELTYEKEVGKLDGNYKKALEDIRSALLSGDTVDKSIHTIWDILKANGFPWED